MATRWNVQTRASAKRDIAQLPAFVRDEVAEMLLDLRDDPFAMGPEPLQGLPYGFKIPVGDHRYRIVLRIYESKRVVEILRIRPRGEVYRGLPSRSRAPFK